MIKKMDQNLFVVRAKIGSSVINIIVNDQMMENCAIFISEGNEIHKV